MASEKRRSSLYMDLKKLRERFNEIDKNERGYIERDGLEQMVTGMDGFDVSMTTELMESLDRDKDGKVTFEDFQTLFTLERDAVKEQQNNTGSVYSPSSSAYVTTVTSPNTFSPDKPPAVGRGRHFGQHDSSKKLTTPPNNRNLTSVPDSPDLSAHVRALPGTVFEFPPSDTHRLSLGTEQGDIVLEDTGEYRDTDSPEPPTGYALVKHELDALCPMGVVEREDIEQLCQTLELDAQDEKELLNIWEELHQLKPNLVTVDEIYHTFIKGGDSVAMVTSTPATNTEVIREGWREPKLPHRVSFGSTPIKPLVLPDPNLGERSLSKEQSIEETDFPFPAASRSMRPRSASTSQRFPRGYSETSLHYPQYDLQNQLGLLVQENASLRANISRIEGDKRKLMEEGEESIDMVQKQYEHKQRKIQEEYTAKIREAERAFTNERQTIQERTEKRVSALENQLKAIKAEDEVLREDVKYYQKDNEKMVEQLQELHGELDEKDNRIAKLCKACGLQSDAVASETDLINSASRIQELENELQVYLTHNDELQMQTRELNDRVDVLKAEVEQYKQKLMSEKRRKERRKSATTPTKPGHSRRRKGSADHKKRRNLPPLLATPVLTRRTDNDSTGNEGMEIDHASTTTKSDESEADPEFESQSELSEIEDDDVFDDETGEEDFRAQSTVSLSEEINEGRNIGISRKISKLESRRSLLEASCFELENKIQALQESETTLKKELENELRQRMQKRAKLDCDLDTLRHAFADTLITINGLKDDIADENDREFTRAVKLSEENAELRARVKEKEAVITEQTLYLKKYKEQNGMKDKHLTRLRAELDQKVIEQEEQANRHSEELARLKMELSIKDADDAMVQLKQENQSLQEIKQELQDTSMSLEIQVLDLEGSIADLEESNAKRARTIAQLEEKVESKDRELRTKKGEIGIAIYDLSQKEDECVILQEKVQKLEKELTRLHLSHNESLSVIEEQQHALAQKQNEIDNTQQKQTASPTILSDELERSLLLQSPMLSPNQSQSLNSSTGQTEIVGQMRTQLKDLQKILLNKSGEEDVDSELSVMQELLVINTNLEEVLAKQQQCFETEIKTRDSIIQHLQNQLANADRPILTHNAGIPASSLKDVIEKALQEFSKAFKATPQLIQNITDRITKLMWAANGIQVALEDQSSHLKAHMEDLSLDLDSSRATVGSYRGELSLLSIGLRKSQNQLNRSREELAELEMAKDREIGDLKDEIKQLQSEIQNQMQEVLKEKENNQRADSVIQRQKNELELLNHYLGKAKSLQLESDRVLRDKENEINGNSLKIQKLESEVVKWRSCEGNAEKGITQGPTIGSHQPEMLQQQDSVISAMREQLCDLYRDLIYPSDSTAADTMDYPQLVECIKEEIEKLKSEFSNEIMMREEGESKLKIQKEEYDTLYTEHDEEVQALKQQNEQLQLKLSNVEDKFQHLVAVQEVQMQQLEVQLSNKSTKLEQSLQRCNENYERAKESVQELETQKASLIDLVERLSLQTVRALSSIT